MIYEIDILIYKIDTLIHKIDTLIHEIDILIHEIDTLIHEIDSVTCEIRSDIHERWRQSRKKVTGVIAIADDDSDGWNLLEFFYIYQIFEIFVFEYNRHC